MMNNKIGSVARCRVFLSVLILIFLSAGSAAVYAEFTPKKDLFSADKDTPLGFTNLVEPNVLLLIDTSGSMAYRMNSSTSTYGDGTNPYNYGGGTTYNYFGADLNPGRNTTGNNDASVDYNYHPLLRYIPNDIISELDSGYTSYFSYDLEPKTGQRWVEGSWRYAGYSDPKPDLPDDRRWNWSSNRWYLQRKTGSNNWKDLNNSSQIPSLPDPYRYIYNKGLEIYSSGYWEDYTYNTYRYKYPNDSRMYTLKNVMYRILSDETLIGNLRLGFATFNQTKHDDIGSASSYYRWKPSSSGSQQRISWKYPTSDTNRAMLRVPFASTTKPPAGPSHLDSIRQWFDGTETSSNPELRADGNTPLATSIWYNDANSAKAYFKASGVITDWCQDNWLIVLTDGANNDNNNPVTAVDNLYGMPVTVKKDGKDVDGRRIKTFVIGIVDPSQTSLRATLNEMAVKGQTGKAYFATDMEGLLKAFKEIFQTIQDFAATGSAPLVNPPKVTGGESGVYSTGFKPKTDQQWTGYLYNYEVSGDVTAFEKKWEAGEILKEADYSVRSIYTADWDDRNASKFSTDSNLKKFSSSEASELRPLLAGPISTSTLSDTKLGQFIDWVRGRDVWDESGGTGRWKLGDPYHVGLVEVGAPQSLLKDQAYRDFAQAHKNRGRFVYLHANDGMVHSFASETSGTTVPNTVAGREKWAFIPPNVLGYRRLIGTKVNSEGNWVTNDKYSNPKYLLDGPLVAEDAYFGGAYRTVLLGSMGRAGAGLYAMDITDPSIPKFLWALENNHYEQDTMAVRPADSRTFLRWTASGGPSTSELSAAPASGEESLGRLRLTVSTPFIGTVDLKKTAGDDLETRWVAIFGAGAQNAYSDTDAGGGKAVYIIDLENGARIKELTHDGLGMAVAPLSIEAGPRPLRIRKFYLGDHAGSVFEGDASSAAADSWSLQRVFTPGALPPSNVVGIPYAIEIGIIKNRKWLFWGTGDPDGIFGNQTGQNYIVALNRNTAGPNTSFAHLESLDRNIGDSVAQSLNGWYLPLASGEMITTPPLLYKGYIFIASYSPVLNDNCAIGKSHFYILKADTGLGGWVDATGKPKKYVELDATRISGITVSDGKVYAGVTRYPGAGNPPTEMGNVSITENLMIIDVPDHIKNAPDDFPSKSSRPTYWRDWKP